MCLRTVRHWDRGRNRVPWSAVRLLRLVRQSDLGELSAHWKGWRIVGDRLVTPAGVTFGAHEFEWWALTCLQARSWQRAYARSRTPPSAGDRLQSAVPVVDGDVFEVIGEAGGVDLPRATPATPAPVLLNAVALRGDLSEAGTVQGGRACAPAVAVSGAGLVSNTTSATQQGETAQECGLQGLTVHQNGGNVIPHSTHEDARHGHDPTATPGFAGTGRRAGAVSGVQLECAHDSGAAQLHRVPESATASARRPSGHDRHGFNKGVGLQDDDDGLGCYCTPAQPCEWQPDDCPFIGCPRRGESTLPLREREEVQTLSWALKKVLFPETFEGSGNSGCSQHNRAHAPKEMMP